MKPLNMQDLIIRKAKIYDGTGKAAIQGDLAVSNGLITSIGQCGSSSKQEINADGLCLMPGIVDLHTHFDAQITWDKTLSPSPALGVTTAVIGNCGFGIAPCPAPLRETMLKNLSVVEGMDLNSLLTGVHWDFESFSQYMDQLRRIRPYINTAVFAGHSAIRTAVMGEEGSLNSQATPGQLAAMCQQLREAMQAGAIGFASSFSPNHSGYGGLPMPSTIASEEELRALTNVLHESGKGVFMMATGSRATPELMESIAADSGRPAYISTVLTMFNEANPSLAATYYEHAAQALKRGNELYILTSCQPLSFDFTLLDPYVLLSHSAFDAIKSAKQDQLTKIYRDPEFRRRFKANLAHPKTGILFLGHWRHIEIGQAFMP